MGTVSLVPTASLAFESSTAGPLKRFLPPIRKPDYFYAVSEAIEAAQQSIFILDWWLTPELFLRRPPSDFPEFRLDRLLKRKAEEGVKVYVVVYKEITETMNMGSKHTKVRS